MKTIGLWLLLLVVLGLCGCDKKCYQTDEGVGVLGPNGGWFVCYDNDDCSGFVPAD